MNLEGIMLVKDAIFKLSHTLQFHSYDILRKANYRERDEISGCPQVGVWRVCDYKEQREFGVDKGTPLYPHNEGGYTNL